MLSVQMGRASDTCSIKGIRGDLTTSLSASWPHIDQPACDHSQPAWQLNLDPAQSQTLSSMHICTHNHTTRLTRLYCLFVGLKSTEGDTRGMPWEQTAVFPSVTWWKRRKSNRWDRFKDSICSGGLVATCGPRIGAPLASSMLILEDGWLKQSCTNTKAVALLMQVQSVASVHNIDG